MKNLLIILILLSSCSTTRTPYELINRSKRANFINEYQGCYYTKTIMRDQASKSIVISFSEHMPFKYEVTHIKNWDHVNFRILAFPLLLGQRAHIINKCVDVAIKTCAKLGGDGVIIDNSLVNFKIVKKVAEIKNETAVKP